MIQEIAAPAWQAEVRAEKTKSFTRQGKRIPAQVYPRSEDPHRPGGFPTGRRALDCEVSIISGARMSHYCRRDTYRPYSRFISAR